MANETDRSEMDQKLDALFTSAKADGPSADLMARVLADAAAVQADVPTAVSTAASRPGKGWAQGIVGAIGGWSVLSGITAAGVVGLGVGLYAPDAVDGLLYQGSGLGFGVSDISVTPDYSGLWTEGGDV